MDNVLYQLAEHLGQRLQAKGHKLATAESCTGGWIAQCITEVPGSSAWFDRGFVTYSNAAKIEMLDVNPQTLAKHGAVSAETALEMATGALKKSKADWAIAVTGIAGPGGGSAEKPIGTVYVAWQGKAGNVKVERLQLTGDRQEVRKQAVIKTIEELLHCLVTI